MNRIYSYLYLTETELSALDNLIDQLGCASRTELITTLTRMLIYGPAFDPNQQTTFSQISPALAGLCSASAKLTELEHAFMQMVDQTIFPVVAMNGPSTTFHSLRNLLRQNMYERTGLVPEDEQMQIWLKKYYSVNLGRILEYRLDIQTEHHLEERAGEDCGGNA